MPQCVKSPGIIIQHHLATLLYLVTPYRFPGDRWLMGASLSVEVNTWLLIARRVVLKQHQRASKQRVRPKLFSVRIKLISVLFYSSWFFLRCYVYLLLLREFLTLWRAQWKETASVLNLRFLSLLVHSIFCALNFKVRGWELLLSSAGDFFSPLFVAGATPKPHGAHNAVDI